MCFTVTVMSYRARQKSYKGKQQIAVIWLSRFLGAKRLMKQKYYVIVLHHSTMSSFVSNDQNTAL